jgi:hypothetical protein
MNILRTLGFRKPTLLTRRFCSQEKATPNLVQLMPTYQEALKLAVDK